MNRLQKTLFLAVIFFWAARSAEAAETILRRDITLESLLHETIKHNPGLQAKKNEYEAARAKVVGAFLPEDPEFGVDVEGQEDSFKFSSRMNLEYMAQQKIPFPTKLLIQGAVAAREADMAYQTYKEEERHFFERQDGGY